MTSTVTNRNAAAGHIVASLLILIVSTPARGITAAAKSGIDAFDQPQVNLDLLNKQLNAYKALRDRASGLKADADTYDSIQTQIDQQRKLLPAGSEELQTQILTRIKSLSEQASALKGRRDEWLKAVSELQSQCPALTAQGRQTSDSIASLKDKLAGISKGNPKAFFKERDFQTALEDLYRLANQVDDSLKSQLEGCPLNLIRFTDQLEDLANYSPHAATLQAGATQAVALAKLRASVVRVAELIDQNATFGVAAQGYNAAIDDMGQAGVDGVIYTLQLAQHEQLIRAPLQPWERASALGPAVGSALTAVSAVWLGTQSQPDQSSDPTKPAKPKSLLGPAIALGASLVGTHLAQLFDASSVSKGIADRLAINRIVGLSTQAEAASIAKAQARFKAAASGAQKNINIIDLLADKPQHKELMTELDADFALVSPKMEPLSADKAKALMQKYELWRDPVIVSLNSTKKAFTDLGGQMLVAERSRALLEGVVGSTDDAVQQLRDLLGSKCVSAATPSVTCKSAEAGVDQAVATDAFCNVRKPTAGTEHVATQALSDDGVRELVTLGSCSQEYSQNAKNKVSSAGQNLSKAQVATASWVTKYGGSRLETDLSEIGDQMGTFRSLF